MIDATDLTDSCDGCDCIDGCVTSGECDSSEGCDGCDGYDCSDICFDGLIPCRVRRRCGIMRLRFCLNPPPLGVSIHAVEWCEYGVTPKPLSLAGTAADFLCV